MERYRSTRRSLALAIVLAVLSARAVNAAPYLWWKVEPVRALATANGLTFRTFEVPSELELVFTFRNDDETANSIRWTPDFVTGLEISVRKGNRVLPISVVWRERRLVTPLGPIALASRDPAVLEPDARLELHAAVVGEDGTPFEPGEYHVRVNVVAAAATLRLADGTAWRGQHVPTGEIVIEIAVPGNAADARMRQLSEGQQALARKDGMAALRSFSELLRIDPRDIDARAGIGRAYLELGRFREAADELEAVLARLSEPRTTLHISAAYAYVALGEESRAAIHLDALLPADQVKVYLGRIREDLRQRWGIR